MFSYYGSKSKIVDFYPAPQHKKIIEPFAGSARYSLKYFDREIMLVDKYQVIVDVWLYLQRASKNDILGLPNLEPGQSIDGTNYLSVPEKYLIGFCINGGSAQPKKTVKDFSNWNKNKIDIANNIYKIKHWDIRIGSYEDIDNEPATWFIDPPYQFGGEWYVKNNSHIDYRNLSEWCQSRAGQVVVCENSKADWLPFYPMRKMTGAYGTAIESIWSNKKHDYMARQPMLFDMGNAIE